MIDRYFPNYIVRYAIAIVIGVFSGIAAYLANVPLPWLLGPIIGTTIAAVIGIPISSPVFLRPVAIPVLGVMLGSGFQVSLFKQVSSWLVTLAFVPIFIVVGCAVSYWFYRRIAGFDAVTAFYSGMPGGLNEMVLQSESSGADSRQVALAHSSRVLFLVVVVVFAFSVFVDISAASDKRAYTNFSDLTLPDIAWLAGCAVIGPLLGKLLRLPTSLLVGPLLLSAAAHLTGLVVLPPPTVTVIMAQMVIGTYIGCRFAGLSMGYVLKNMLCSFGASSLLLVVTLGVAACVSSLSGVQFSQAVLAFSSAGVSEMGLLALAMGQDIAYVTFAHITRFVLVAIFASGAFSLFKRMARGSSE